MPDSTRVYVGTIGQSLWRSTDGGLNFSRASAGVHSESDVRAVDADPRDPLSLLLGTETGLFRSDDGADTWRPVVSGLDGRQVWCLKRHPANPDTVFAGSCPAALFRSDDGGATWRELPARMPDRCVNGAPLTPRVTCIAVDSVDGTLYASVEIGGLRRSRDGGETWEELGEGLSSPDVHGLCPLRLDRSILIATTNNDVNRSEDGGETWQPLGVSHHLPWRYSRACAPDPMLPGAVWVGAGNGPPGNQGGLFRTADGGETWERLGLPQVTNSTVWSIAANAADPRRAYVSSVSGQLYRTLDGGDCWSKLPMEFGEVRAVIWTPGT